MTEIPNRGFVKYEMDLIQVGLETARYKILGKASLYKKQRFSDLLNDEKKSFIVLKDVKVFPIGSKEVLLEREYLMIKKDLIVFAWEE